MTQTINIKTNQKEVVKSLGRKYKKHLPEATRTALNNTAFKLQRAYKIQVQQKLDRPTKTTINGFLVGKAYPRRPFAFVVVKDHVAKYLKWQIEGGVSKPKYPEAVPTKHAPLNEYGNLKYKKLETKNGTRKVMKTKTGFGVYEMMKGKRGKLLVAFKKSINYKKRFDFYKIGNNVVKNFFPKEMSLALRKAFKKK